jgi:hypothetical protein
VAVVEFLRLMCRFSRLMVSGPSPMGLNPSTWFALAAGKVVVEAPKEMAQNIQVQEEMVAQEAHTQNAPLTRQICLQPSA